MTAINSGNNGSGRMMRLYPDQSTSNVDPFHRPALEVPPSRMQRAKSCFLAKMKACRNVLTRPRTLFVAGVVVAGVGLVAISAISTPAALAIAGVGLGIVGLGLVVKACQNYRARHTDYRVIVSDPEPDPRSASGEFSGWKSLAPILEVDTSSLGGNEEVEARESAPLPSPCGVSDCNLQHNPLQRGIWSRISFRR